MAAWVVDMENGAVFHFDDFEINPFREREIIIKGELSLTCQFKIEIFGRKLGHIAAYAISSICGLKGSIHISRTNLALFK